jgi:hypothetical protein
MSSVEEFLQAYPEYGLVDAGEHVGYTLPRQ